MLEEYRNKLDTPISLSNEELDSLIEQRANVSEQLEKTWGIWKNARSPAHQKAEWLSRNSEITFFARHANQTQWNQLDTVSEFNNQYFLNIAVQDARRQVRLLTPYKEFLATAWGEDGANMPGLEICEQVAKIFPHDPDTVTPGITFRGHMQEFVDAVRELDKQGIDSEQIHQHISAKLLAMAEEGKAVIDDSLKTQLENTKESPVNTLRDSAPAHQGRAQANSPDMKAMRS